MFYVYLWFMVINIVFCDDSLNKTEETNINVNATLVLRNTTNENEQNQTLPMERIIQPSLTQQTQQIERTVEPIKSVFFDKKKSFDNFRPSPQLDIQYEYNKFPVIPAFPEAKHLGNEVKYNEPSNYFNEKTTTTEYPWTSKIKFPTVGYKDRPYEFYTETYDEPSKFPEKPEHYIQSHKEEFNFNKVIPIPPKHKPINGIFSGKSYPQEHKNNGFNLMERPSLSHKTHGGYGIGGYDKNPWKKLVHILTAFIPIGLLISALTPTVITVTNTNDTQSRYRLNDRGVDLKQKLFSSMSFLERLEDRGCEERMICELLLAASTSPNAKENVKNFLDNFSEQRDVSDKTEDLKKIFAAVRNQDCSTITCENINNPT